MNKFEREALNAHNAFRARHNAAPLVINKDLCKDCKVWANVLTQDGVIAQSPTNFGENIWSKPSATEGEISGYEPVEAWYAEVKYYDFEKPGLSERTEHFTQLIWKETTDMGIAYVTSDKGTFVVAQYKPRGNTIKIENFTENVLPPDPAYSQPPPEQEAPTTTPSAATIPPEPSSQPPEAAEEGAAAEPLAEAKPAEGKAAEGEAAEGREAEEKAAETAPAAPKEEKKKSHRHCTKKKDPKLKRAERSPCE
ncbi:Golgi-associated plant pathogenesis-related protein 1-like [Stegostoma tigrinum]|uniref:Golgi-associated plant pathogenesis-related protein 1-like n=1 Tax=Stegostoma tigrinum TaxID=3053191 RepID=UPI0028708BDD|nr:Golgi-associated plant pathogenesis-related protein 1-like [Stegostoma tigrinum]